MQTGRNMATVAEAESMIPSTSRSTEAAMNKTIWVCWAAILIACTLSFAVAAEPRVTSRLEMPIAIQDGHMRNPFQLQLGTALSPAKFIPYPTTPTGCRGDSSSSLKVLSREPLVTVQDCVDPDTGKRTYWIGGRSKSGRTWSRALGFRSGGYFFQEYPIGASEDGVLTNRLVTYALDSGEPTRLVPTRTIESEDREVPLYDIIGSGIQLPGADEVLVYIMDNGQADSGLHRINPLTGDSRKLMNVDRNWGGAHWKIEEFATYDNATFIVWIERFTQRGPEKLRLRGYDWRNEKTAFLVPLIEDRVLMDVRLVVEDPRIGASFMDLSTGKVTGLVLEPSP